MKNEGDSVNVVILYPHHNFSQNTWNSKDDPMNPGWEELLYWIPESRHHQRSVCSIGVVCSKVLSLYCLKYSWEHANVNTPIQPDVQISIHSGESLKRAPCQEGLHLEASQLPPHSHYQNHQQQLNNQGRSHHPRQNLLLCSRLLAGYWDFGRTTALEESTHITHSLCFTNNTDRWRMPAVHLHLVLKLRMCKALFWCWYIYFIPRA